MNSLLSFLIPIPISKQIVIKEEEIILDPLCCPRYATRCFKYHTLLRFAFSSLISIPLVLSLVSIHSLKFSFEIFVLFSTKFSMFSCLLIFFAYLMKKEEPNADDFVCIFRVLYF